MPATVTVLYPNEPDAKFDMNYYLATHMPMVLERFGPSGMTSYTVSNIVGTPSGAPPIYNVHCVLHFGTTDEFSRALKAEGPAVMGDVPNFSNKRPVFLVGDVVSK